MAAAASRAAGMQVRVCEYQLAYTGCVLGRVRQVAPDDSLRA
jgi:hypothetical protein